MFDADRKAFAARSLGYQRMIDGLFLLRSPLFIRSAGNTSTTIPSLIRLRSSIFFAAFVSTSRSSRLTKRLFELDKEEGRTWQADPIDPSPTSFIAWDRHHRLAAMIVDQSTTTTLWPRHLFEQGLSSNKADSFQDPELLSTELSKNQVPLETNASLLFSSRRTQSLLQGKICTM